MLPVFGGISGSIKTILNGLNEIIFVSCLVCVSDKLFGRFPIMENPGKGKHSVAEIIVPEVFFVWGRFPDRRGGRAQDLFA
jgi:hypothetical protein